MSTLNIHLLDFLMTDDFLEKNIYPESHEAKLKVAGFISEFYILYKGLTLDAKNDISMNLKEKKIAPMALKRIHELLLQHRGESKSIFDQDEQSGSNSKVLKLELTSIEKMDKIGERQDKLLKNLITSHMEILLISIRKDKDYSFTVFKEFGAVDELTELFLEFPDDSTLKIEVLIVFRFV
jgi:hypothetical protein